MTVSILETCINTCEMVDKFQGDIDNSSKYLCPKSSIDELIDTLCM